MEKKSNQANADQITFWNSAPAQRWIQFQNEIDVLFEAINDRLLSKAQPQTGEKILDIGCGTGATSLRFAKEVGSSGQIAGLDVSELLLSEAKKRDVPSDAAAMTFHLADAQSHSLGGDLFNLVISRFGVMFFDDPVAAFSNLQKMLCPGGRVCFVSWAAMEGNPWFEIPRDSAVSRLGKPQPTPPRAPGPLAFAEQNYVLDILQQAGFVECRAQEEEVFLTHPGGIKPAAALASNLGPASRIVREYDGDAGDINAITASIEDAFQAFETSVGAAIPARLNFFQAEKI